VSISLAAQRWTIALDEAKSAVAGYAFAVRKVGNERAPRWGYRTYDCVPASPGPDFSDLDILVAAGLNGELDVAAIGALHLATRRAAPYLAQAAGRGQEFSRLTLSELADNPPAGTAGWLLSEAWQQMMSTPDVGRAPDAQGPAPQKTGAVPAPGPPDRRRAPARRAAARLEPLAGHLD
jgi:hypothetical protein